MTTCQSAEENILIHSAQRFKFNDYSLCFEFGFVGRVWVLECMFKAQDSRRRFQAVGFGGSVFRAKRV